MGQACVGLLHRVMDDGQVFEKRQAGRTLRRFFGAYRQPDFWAVYRRFRAIDDGNGFVSYDELLKCVSLEEFQLLFLWETFSQQNNIMDARELMTIICTFSSAPLIEKGKFLQAIFDESRTGLNTASELVTLLHMVLNVLTKCTGIPIKVKEVRDQLKSILPELLNEKWAEALERCHGKPEAAFNTDRFIGQIELEEMLPSIQDCYDHLPIAEPAPRDACPPPPPDWAIPSSLERGVPRASNEGPAPAVGQSAQKLTRAELAHLEWMSKMDDDQLDAQEAIPKTSRSEDKISSGPPARGWMAIYGSEFSAVAKNLPAFRHLFIRSVSTALGLPMGCVEVVNVFKGSVVIEFLLHPSGRGSDDRDGETLKQSLAQQLSLSHSALRKGPFRDYVSSAELVERPQDKAKKKKAEEAKKGPQEKAVQTERPSDGDEFEVDVQEVLRDLESAENEARNWKKKAEDAIEERDKALQEVARMRELEKMRNIG